MCKVYNTVGSLTTIKTRLIENKITDLHSIQDLISFQKNYSTSRQLILSDQKILLTEKRNNLSAGVIALENEVASDKTKIQQKLRTEVGMLSLRYDQLAESEKTVIQEFTYSLKALFIAIKIICIKLFSDIIVFFFVRSKVNMLNKKRKHLQYLVSNFEEAVKENCRLALHDLDRKKWVIDEINTFIYGAIGEQKVVKELEQLPDDYILINDFTFSFTKALFYKKEQSWIKSIQIDHLLVCPSGIFIIETKNWSKESLENLSLRSPVKQIERTNYALYNLLHHSSRFKLNLHHWGKRKIPIKNLIVLINQKPMEEFQHVKVLTLNELLGYLGYFKPSLSNQETQDIANYLISFGYRV